MKLVSYETVSKYHVDKVCDLIVDSIIDSYLLVDRYSYCNIEATFFNQKVTLLGIIFVKNGNRTSHLEIVLGVIEYLKYDTSNFIIDDQIEIGRNTENINSACDQGICYGYATNRTKSRLPLAVDIANKIQDLIDYESTTNDSIFHGDDKILVTCDDDDNTIKTVLLTTRINQNVDIDILRINDYLRRLVKQIPELDNNEINFIFNPSGVWNTPGNQCDSGVSGRKLVSDQFGGYAPIGGGAFSGKDLFHIDRIGSYHASMLAKEIVDNLLEKNIICYSCIIELTFGIMISNILNLNIDIKTNLSIEKNNELRQRLIKKYSQLDYSPYSMVKKLIKKVGKFKLSELSSRNPYYTTFNKKS
jgi:S-adenosylmethionine synthetase